MSDVLLPQHTCQLAPPGLCTSAAILAADRCATPTVASPALAPPPGAAQRLPLANRATRCSATPCPAVAAIARVPGATPGSRSLPDSDRHHRAGRDLDARRSRRLLAHSHRQSRQLRHSHHDHTLLAPLRMLATRDSGCLRRSRFWPHCFCCVLRATAQRGAEAM